jgi:putative ABC transport system permease protein
VIGSTIAFMAAPALEGLLFETGARDALVFGTVVATLLLAALLASAAPALRATRVEPTRALKDG